MLAVMVTMLLVCVLLVMAGRNIEMDEEEWEQAAVLYNSDIDMYNIRRRRLLQRLLPHWDIGDYR